MSPTPALQQHLELTDYFQSRQGIIRSLIGDEHWPTDGAHKEMLFRDVLRKKLPRQYRVGHGFVSLPQMVVGPQRRRRSSGQLDVLVVNRNSKLPYDAGETFIADPKDAVAVVEIKTRLYVNRTDRSDSHLHAALRAVANRAEFIRSSSGQIWPNTCWVGLFAYNFPGDPEDDRSHERLLRALQQVTEDNPNRVINCIALGRDVFVRYWPNGLNQVRGEIDGAVWHSYVLPNLAQPYLLSNLVVRLTPYCPGDDYVQEHFPIPGGKENWRRYFAPLEGEIVRKFSI
ncbi:MAG: DUF6602 domain-containing protein [Caldilineaceae bacterium]